MTIELSPRSAKYLESVVSSGRYPTPGAAIDDAIDALERVVETEKKREADRKLQELRAIIEEAWEESEREEGIDSIPSKRWPASGQSHESAMEPQGHERL
jgi:Arc/MetJ-type ribon-helix-helix transcriptional regulator